MEAQCLRIRQLTGIRARMDGKGTCCRQHIARCVRQWEQGSQPNLRSRQSDTHFRASGPACRMSSPEMHRMRSVPASRKPSRVDSQTDISAVHSPWRACRADGSRPKTLWRHPRAIPGSGFKIRKSRRTHMLRCHQVARRDLQDKELLIHPRSRACTCVPLQRQRGLRHKSRPQGAHS